MKLPELDAMDARERRRFLKLAGFVLASPLVGEALRSAGLELAGAPKALAQAFDVPRGEPTIFIEFCLRDQWDFTHVFVPPGVATYANLKRGENQSYGACVSYQSLKKVSDTQYLTEDSLELEPHVDTVALVETIERTDGNIHGHESLNGMRSPGRSEQNKSPGAMDTFSADGDRPGTRDGNMHHRSSTPTPDLLHHFYQQVIDYRADRRLAVMKFYGRGDEKHKAYHFGAGLGEIDVTGRGRIPLDVVRMRAINSTSGDRGVIQEFGSYFTGQNNAAALSTPAFTPKEAELVSKMLKSLDARFLLANGMPAALRPGLDAQHDEVKARYAQVIRAFEGPLALTPEERTYWTRDVPLRMGDTNSKHANVGEITGLAFKLVASGVTRTVSIEYDYEDEHDRPFRQPRIMAQQTSRVLARLIASLKQAGLYDRTVISMVTLDGGRTMNARADTNENGRNGLLLAGGRIRGGYYGDVRVAGNYQDGHSFTYHAPLLDTGLPNPMGGRDLDGRYRVSNASAYRTITTALGIPDALVDRFPDARGASPMRFLIKS